MSKICILFTLIIIFNSITIFKQDEIVTGLSSDSIDSTDSTDTTDTTTGSTETSTEIPIENSKPDNPEDVNTILQDILKGKSPLTCQNESFISNITIYDPMLRPTGLAGKNTNIDKDGTLKIQIALSLRQLVSFDEKNQILTTSFYLMLNWGDPRLMWDSKKYKNITSIIAPATKFWLPDLAIMNSALTSNFITYSSNQNVIIFNDGNTYLTLSLPSQATRCKLDVYKYPFDKQECSIIIGSWLNTMREINFIESKSKINITRNYFANSIWKLESIEETSFFDANRYELVNVDQFDMIEDMNGGLNSNDMVYVLHLKRQPLYIMINGIFPCFVLNCVILFAFGVPFVQQINLCLIYFVI
jgi:hypothetical protein